MTTYFITGGYGYLGQYIVQAVHRHEPQAEIRVLVRTQRKTFLSLETLDRVKWISGELTQPETYREHLQDVDTIIHNAAMVSFSASDRDAVFESNVTGTRKLTEAALEAGCRNFIFISSISATGRKKDTLLDETIMPDMEYKKKHDMYGYSKRLSEIELAELKDRMRVIFLNPSVITGPGSERVESVIKMLRRFPIIPMLDYINAFVDVRDVADAVILSLSKGRSGERYIVSADNVSMVTATEIVSRHMGKNPRILRVPPAGIKFADGVVALLDRLHINPGLRKPSHMINDKRFSHAKISEEMGWQPRYTYDQSIADSVKAITG